MAKLSAEAKVGLLVLGGSVILLYMTFAVGKYEFGGKQGYTVEAVFDSVAGLDEKAAVRMAGVKIGTVEKVELEDSRAKLTLRILPEVEIARGSEAAIKSMGLLGDKFVEIVPKRKSEEGGRPSERAPRYENGERIEVTSSPSDVDHLVGQLSAISDDIKQVTASLRQVFGTQRGEKSMEDILSDLRQTTANIKDFSYSLRSDGSELVMRLNELAANLNGIVGENRDNLKVTMENVREATRSAELAMASIESVTNRIDRGEGTLGKLVTDDSVYNNIDSAAKGISDYTGRLERMKTIVSFRYEYMFPESKTYFELELKPKLDKYYIIGVNSDYRYRFSQSISTIDQSGVTLTSDTYEDRLRFSLMYAKRWGGAVLRLGIIESKGGIGGDYFLFDDKLKFSVDAWNFSSKEPGNTNAHMKAGVTYNLNKLIFLNAGYDNFLNSSRDAAYAGIGIRFDDDDLKYIMGSVPIPGN